MTNWQYTKGLHDIGNGCWAYLLPDGGWGWSNAGLITDGDESLLVDTLFDLPLTADMLVMMRDAAPAAQSIDTLINTHANGDHTYGNQLVKGTEIVASKDCADEMEIRPPEAFISRVNAWQEMGDAGAIIWELMGRKFDFDGIENTLPTRTFDRELTLNVGDKRVELTNVGPAHTRGDVIVHVPDDRIVYTRRYRICRRPSSHVGRTGRQLDQRLRPYSGPRCRCRCAGSRPDQRQGRGSRAAQLSDRAA